ncbi:MAG: hypothetical protein ACK452_16885, partial [Bacteroidota bacterium]
MHPEIENLIELAIADGQISDKEKAIILRKAAELGEHTDEVEMIIEGRMHQIKGTTQKMREKDGKIKTCSNCGQQLPSFTTNCTGCGIELRDLNPSGSVQSFFSELRSAPLSEHATIIGNFPVPNTKEDIFEFLSLAIGNCETLSAEEKQTFADNIFKLTYKPELLYKENEIRAWQSKVRAVLQKARITFKDQESIRILNDFQLQFDALMKKNVMKTRRPLIIALSIAGVFILFMIVFFVSLATTHSSEVKKEKERLEKIFQDVQRDMSAKDYDSALLKASGLQ